MHFQIPTLGRKWLVLITVVAGVFFLALQWEQFLALSINESRVNARLGQSPQTVSVKLHSDILKNRKVAVLIPYTGSALPSWFRSFMFTAQLSSDIFDWYIFVTEPKVIATPSNVHIVYISESDFFSRIIRMDPKATIDGNVSLNFWRDKFAETVKIFSYLLVEFKPCLGFIFQDYVKDYSHWAYADVDMLVGRASAFVTKDLIDSYDIYTSSFGDTNRMYMRGQLTIIRNSDRVNDLWRKCQYFPTLTRRVDAFLQTYPKYADSRSKGWRLYSAEGCISRVFADEPGLTIVVDPTQISDAFRARNADRESFLLGSALLRCYQGRIDLNEVSKSKYLVMAPRRVPYEGMRYLPVRRSTTPDCANWIDKKYQVCLEDVTRDAYISWRGADNATFTRMNYDTPDSRLLVPGPDNPRCREGIISHFQGWKRDYYHFTTRPPSLNTHLLLLSRDGFIPLTLAIDSGALPTIGDSLRNHYGLVPLANRATEGITSASVHESESGGRVFSGLEHEGLYCKQFKPDLKSCLSYVRAADITYKRKVIRISHSAGSRTSDNRVTLIVAGTIEDVLSGAMEASISTWRGNMVIIVQHGGTYDEIQEFIHRSVGDGPFHTMPDFLAGATSDIYASQTEVLMTMVLVNVNDDKAVLDKMLYNIGLDASPSDVVVVCPPGMQMKADALRYLAHTLTSPGNKSTALLLATYRVPGDVTWTNTTFVHLEEYPVSRQSVTKNSCGRDQAQVLRPNYTKFVQLAAFGKSFSLYSEHMINQSKKKEIVDLLSENSALIPVAFNRKGNDHGDRFIRFPEELNGQFCFASSLFATLAGSGYDLRWGPHISLISDAHAMLANSKGCRCANFIDNDWKPFGEFLKNYLRFYIRAKELRQNGIETLYASEPFSGLYT